jgi:hypothetical protein
MHHGSPECSPYCFEKVVCVLSPTRGLASVQSPYKSLNRHISEDRPLDKEFDAVLGFDVAALDQVLKLTRPHLQLVLILYWAQGQHAESRWISVAV